MQINKLLIKNKLLEKQGFTLVELSIVLTIIGLLVTGTLIGQSLIQGAQIRATIRQYNEFQSGVTIFTGKYAAVPGDMLAATATSYGFTGSGVGADGNGVITNTAVGATSITAGATYVGEIANFWSELTTSGKELIPGYYNGALCNPCTAGTHFPKMKYGNYGWGVYGVGGINYFYAGTLSPSTAAETGTGNAFPPMDAYSIDVTIDDGLPNSGNIIASSASTYFPTTPAPSLNCATSLASNASYVTSYAGLACGLQFFMQTF
jgi:prepilin-type N-terminal cleavage/methylation domain-containing protein